MRIVCAGGGTLGPVTPLLAVVDALRRQDPSLEVVWFGTSNGPERALVEFAGIIFYTLPAGKWRRYWSWHNITDTFLIVAGFFKALVWFIFHKTEAVLTAGAYVAVPVGLAAWVARVPLCIHQQDVRPSLTNIILRKLASVITVTFFESCKYFPQGVVTGNPVRPEFLHPLSQLQAREQLGLQVNRPVVLIMGGGTGAEFLNNLVASSLGELLSQAQVLHLTGRGKFAAPQHTGYHPLPFTTKTLPLLVAADVVITRAGMGTLTELATLGKCAIVIPMPQSHQEANAVVIKKAEAAVVLGQAHLTNTQFVGTVRQLLSDENRRVTLGKNLQKLFPPDATEKVAREIIKAIKPKL